MHTPILLALPFLAPALGHTIPRHAARGHHAHTVRVDTPVERSYPKAHFGIPPASSDLSGVAGFKRDGSDVEERSYPKAHFGLPPKDADAIANSAGFKRDGKKLVRRRKRSCAVKPSATSLGSTATSASASAPASSIMSEVGAESSSSSSYAAEPTSTSIVWDDSTHGVPAATTASAVSSTAYEPSSTSSSAAAESSSASSDGGSSALQGLMAFVFPRGKGSADWSTVVDQPASLSFDGALKPLTAGKLPSVGTAPDGSTALVANYPANTVKLAAPGHGYSFYSAGAHDNVIVDGAKEVMFSYSVFFQEGFQFVKGGKLPGLYGGTSLDTAKSCSGGRQDGRDECFSARLMWRREGAGEIYNYLPSAAYSNSNYCNYPPFSLCDAQYGESIGRGAFTFPTGQWTTVAIRLKLNDVGSANGEQELFVNGQSVISLTDMTIRVNADTKIYGIMAQTFFGGSDDTWASPIDQSAYFKDWSLAVLA